LYYIYSKTTPNEAIHSTVASLSRVHFSSLINMLLLVNMMAPKWTFTVISRVVILTVQTLESVRTRYTSCSCLSRIVRLGIGLATPSQQFVVFNFIRITIFLTFSTLGVTSMYRMSPVPTIATLGNSRMHSSLSDYGNMTTKVK